MVKSFAHVLTSRQIHSRLLERLEELVSIREELLRTKILTERYYREQHKLLMNNSDHKGIVELQSQILSDSNIAKYDNTLTIALEKTSYHFLHFLNQTLDNMNSIKNSNVYEKHYEALLYYFILQNLTERFSIPSSVLIGGWATFFLYYTAFKNEAFTNWRGSHDLDMIATSLDILSIFKENKILEFYGLSSVTMISLAIENKYSTIIHDIHRQSYLECDLYIPDRTGRFSIESVTLDKSTILDTSVVLPMASDLSITIINPLLLTLMKLVANRPRDILDLEIISRCIISIFEKLSDKENDPVLQFFREVSDTLKKSNKS